MRSRSSSPLWARRRRLALSWGPLAVWARAVRVSRSPCACVVVAARPHSQSGISWAADGVSSRGRRDRCHLHRDASCLSSVTFLGRSVSECDTPFCGAKRSTCLRARAPRRGWAAGAEFDIVGGMGVDGEEGEGNGDGEGSKWRSITRRQVTPLVSCSFPPLHPLRPSPCPPGLPKDASPGASCIT